MAGSESNPYFQYVHAGNGVARWHGGAYIELGYLADGEFVALDVINVWDYRNDVPTIARTLEAFRAAVDKHVAEHLEEQS